MAAYPNLIQVVGSKEGLDDGTVVERAESGKPRFRTFFTQVRRTFTVVHECYSTDKETLMDFYDNEKYNVVDFTWQGDGSVYYCRFANSPQPVPAQGDGYWQITTQLVEV